MTKKNDYRPEGTYYPKGVVDMPQTARPYKYLKQKINKTKTALKKAYSKLHASSIAEIYGSRKKFRTSLKNRLELNI
jgi:hypothetical protein